MSDQTETPAEILDPAATDETSDNARGGAQKRRDASEPAAVVGLGASAGGIAVLQQFFSDMPPDSGLAFVVVMHLSPEHESRLANILQTKTAMPVLQVSAPVKVRPNHVYVIPPNKQLTFTDSMLDLVEPQQALGRRVTIDLFFRTLAQSFGQRSVGVILSGTDSDGVIGLKHVRAQGGITIAQDPKEAEYPSMPVTAIATGAVDWVLPVAELAPRLLEFVRNEHAMMLPPEILEATGPDQKVREAPGGETVSDETRDQSHESALGEVLTILRRQTGHDFTHYKRATILRRIARRMQVNSIEAIPEYLDFMRQHPAESPELLQDLLIGVTHFFRDQAAFATLEAHIPQLFAGKRTEDQVRVWVAGCATGEEAYSIAILLAEHAERLENPPTIQVFATDIDAQAIHSARSGLYPSTIEADVSPERIRRFFAQDHGRYRVRKSLREKVLFAAHNLLSDAPFSNLDLVSCRNLLIYLTPKAQQQVFDVAHFALRSGALMFIGGSENTSAALPLFAPVDAKHRLYVRRSVPRPTWRVPMVPRRMEDQARTNLALRSRALPPLTSVMADGAGTETRESNQAGQDRRSMLFGELHLKLLEQYAPASVVVNETYDIVHLSEHAGRYLHFSGGEPTANLPKVIHPALRLELRTALFRAGQTKQSVNAAPVTVATDGSPEVITLNVRPIKADYLDQGFYLVTFAKAEDAHVSNHPPVTAAATASDALTNDLQAEVDSLKRQFAELSEQYEVSSEELKASNEELQAMNEEMRSATEELETSKEELQSVNEELVTVNNELKSNVEELSRTNADLTNLMASTDIGTIFLDRQLRIDRFTPSAQKIFNLIPADVGRPIADITTKLAYDGLLADAEKVLENLQPIDREVQLHGRDGAWLLSRIAPYRTADDRIGGVVATFVDITRRKTAEDELRVSEEKFRTLFNSMDEAYYVMEVIFDAEQRPIDYRLLESNPAFEKLTGLADVTGKRVRELIPEIEESWIEVYGRVALTGVSGRFDGRVSGLGGRWYDGYAFRVGGAESRQVAVVFSDITDRKHAEEVLRESEARVAADLAGVRRLYELQSKLAAQEDLKAALQEVLAVACEFTGTDRGCVQMLSPDGERLEMFVWHGYADDSPFISHFRYEGLEAGCEVARVRRQRLIIEETRGFPSLEEGTEAGEAIRAEGLRASQSTPMASRSGDIVGVLSTQFRQPHRPTDHELRLVDMLAWTAAEFIERHRADVALRTSEERMRTLADAVPQIIWANDAEGEANYFNQRWYEFTGLSFEESAGPGWQAIVHPDDAPASKECWLQAQAVGEVFDTEYRLRGADGAYRWFIGRNVPMRDAEGRVTGWFGTATDIQELKEASAALGESEARFRQFAENSTDVLWIAAADGSRLEYLSPAFDGIWGEPRENVMRNIGRWAEMLHPEDRERVLSGMPRLCAGETVIVDYRIICPTDGSIRWIRDTGFPIRDDSGTVRRVAGIAQDITEMKAAERALGESSEQLRLIVENASDYAIFSLDLNRRITSWNPGAQAILGYTAEEVVGQSGDIIFTPEDCAEDAAQKEAEAALAEGRAADERWHLRKDGSRFWGSGVMMAMRDRDGSAEIGFVKIFRDETERLRAKEAIEQSREELWAALQETERARAEAEAAGAAKDHFLAVLSHELRTPLTPVLMAARMLARQKGLPPLVADSVEMIERNVQLEAHFIDDLLDITRITHGKLELVREPIDVHAAVRHAVEIARADMEAKGQPLAVKLEATECRMIGDERRLEQVFWNLLKNASKFTPEGGAIRIATHNRGDRIVVEVTDSGIGIEPEAKERIFTAFAQGSQEVTREFGGLGLGLAISKAAVDGHGGSLSAESAGAGKGATFRVELPLRDDPAAEMGKKQRG